MTKKYRVAKYTEKSMGMFESDDFRLTNKESFAGTFKRDKSVKGIFNGQEKGIFEADNGVKYLVFSDHSARPLSEFK